MLPGIQEGASFFVDPEAPLTGDVEGRTGPGGLLEDPVISPRRQPSQPHALRFGLWEAPGSARLPARQTWLGSGAGGMAIRRAIRHSARQRRVFHLVIDAWRLAAGNVQDRKTVDRTLCVVRQLRERQLLRSETLADLAARLSHVPRTQPARSILRPAA